MDRDSGDACTPVVGLFGLLKPVTMLPRAEPRTTSVRGGACTTIDDCRERTR